MNNQDTASKVISRLTQQIAGLVKDNTVMSVMIEELQAEVKRLTPAPEDEEQIDRHGTIKEEV